MTYKKIKIIDYILLALSLIMILFHLIYTRTLFVGPIEIQNLHLLFALLIIFIHSLKKTKIIWPTILLIFASLITTGYIHLFFDALEERASRPTEIDIIIGVVLIIVCFEATRRAFGLALPIVGLIFVGYTFLGQYLPGPLWHFPVNLKLAISSYNIGLTGMFGTPLGMSANYIFLFIIFGAFLSVSKASKFIDQLGVLAGRYLPGGSGMAAVIASSLVGMVTGQGSSNVAITGPVTIPMMKQSGFSSAEAASIEVVASTGGNIIPPVMGIAAFLMAEYLGIPYIKICLMALLPSVLYIFNITAYVNIIAAKKGIKRLTEKVNVREMLTGSPHFIIPVAALICLLAKGYSLMLASFVMPLLLVLLNLINRDVRGSVSKLIDACSSGALMGARIGVATCVIGVIIASLDITGLPIRLTMMVETLSGGILWIALLLVALITLILGCALPPFVSYFTAAMLCVSLLVQLGIDAIAAHFFIFFFSSFSLMTPPVGLASLIAAPIAGESYFKVCMESCKAGIIAWLLPFFVIWAPSLLLQHQKPLTIIIEVSILLLITVLLQVSTNGYMLDSMRLFERVIAFASALLLIMFIARGSVIIAITGAALGAFILLLQIIKKKSNRCNVAC